MVVPCVQVQEEVGRLQSAVTDALPQERQRRQQRLQAIRHALEGSTSAEVSALPLHCTHIYVCNTSVYVYP